mgnify:CR=1 FL=1
MVDYMEQWERNGRGNEKLIGKADIITPNFTEVTFLLDKEYKKNK